MRVYLADFGLSKIIAESDVATMRSGTPGFQAPEQLQGQSISTKCDIYAFGGILTELYGELPLWPKTPPHQIMFNVAVKGVFPDTSQLHDKIKKITDICFVQVENRGNASDVLLHLLNL